ncbi:glucocorticoid modulatory element-binding protein 2 isoform X1 [Falco cherrug]|uniref:glucocorticoid modulatory element-binding protein 2 isoform X1 n=2 Tax=Falco peregrinus TaxID=8954 RepID=UPI0006790DBF|nr:glucocorticoid modulatory element-binding protein 2 isoform X1 [Falco peregrinus]XP_055578658.1 glucocorticoid modulatory element-binding protein 2 isoform X1 [Falco cherrug]XP_055578659.1 glucocorticoid modulatory element-binding protein 2 isoform X1 [Falco cherrug]XP_055578660.1 glucocorticoid modulatory element-binding protein 2 isoform X1 [Falco cherrug]XP_055670382.1 glucocorticoid modulatory element-binding protein 2 isoform X1 [Falco peregrinus]XP_055670383.1 glucocorticoid modulator
MATPDVSVHMEEVVVVTTPDGTVDGSGMEEVKTVLVTTNLSQHGDESACSVVSAAQLGPLPSTGLGPFFGRALQEPPPLAIGAREVALKPRSAEHGDINEDTLETENAAAAAAAAFTASTHLKEAVLVKMAEDEDSLEAEIVYPITCGDSKANLIWRKFVCPGINVKCVQFDDHLISPKEFVHLAGKSTLKDWKRAIRMNGIMLRKIMDSGELDFYQHTKVCSNTCRSTKIDLTGARVSLTSQTSTEYIPLTPASTDVNGSPATITIETCEDASDWSTSIGDDTFAFWRGLKDTGLLEEVIHEFHQELVETMKGLQQRAQDPPLQLSDAVLLNNVVQNFGMLDLVKKVLASHKCQMDRSREQYTRDLAALEQQCDEHRKRAKELKHKSQHLNNVLMTLTPVSVPTPLKRPRLTRATSGPAAITSQVLSQPAQLAVTPGVPVSQLANIPLGKVVSALPPSVLGKSPSQPPTASSPASPLLGGYTVLASAGSTFPGTVEIHPDASNLTVLSTAAVQDGSTVVKVVSPFQLLTLPGLGTTIQNVTQMAPSGSTVVTVPSGATGDEHAAAAIEVTAVADEAEQK